MKSNLFCCTYIFISIFLFIIAPNNLVMINIQLELNSLMRCSGIIYFNN